MDWASFVAGSFATWLLMIVLCAVVTIVERYSKGPDEPMTETAGRIQLIDADAPTPHEFGPPEVDEYVQNARRKGWIT